MQTRSPKGRAESGSILFLTLILAIMLGITLGSYLYWVRTQNLLVAESQAWNSALAIAEAGIEEGMAQININVGTATPLKYIPSIVTSNWTYNGSGYTATNQLGYTVTISNDSPPTIYASGTTLVPLVGTPITRSVMVKTATNSLFGVALAAIQNITMNGNNINLDAYDSSDRVHFPGGLYNSTNAFAGADVASDGGILSVGNANIHGRLILAPGAAYSLGPNGLVGDMPANWPAQQGIENPLDKWVITDFNKEFPDVVAPFSTGNLPLNINGSGTNQWVLSGGNYFVSGNMQVNNNKVLNVTNGVNTLYVTGSFNAMQNSLIAIQPGATLKLYIGQATGSAVSASFGQVNNGGNAQSFEVFGLPTCTSITLVGNGAYIGTLYMPEAALSFSGGGNNTLDFQGGIVIYSANLNGHFNIHYDVNLSRSGPPSGYTLAFWQEL